MKLSEIIKAKVVLEDVEGANKDAWHEYKSRSIGSSEIAVLLGISPFKTVNELYQTKLTGKDDFEGNDATKWGTLMEPLIFQVFLEEYNLKGMQPKKMYCHLTNAMLTCSPDAFVHDPAEPIPYGIAEFKNVSAYKRSEWEMEPPAYYWAQTQWQLGIMGMQWAYLVAKCEYDLIVHKIYFDSDWFKNAVAEATRFLDCVATESPYIPKELEGAIATKSDNNLIELSESGSFICERFKQLEKIKEGLDAELKPIEKEMSEIKEQLMTIAGHKNGILQSEAFTVSVKFSPYTEKKPRSGIRRTVTIKPRK